MLRACASPSHQAGGGKRAILPVTLHHLQMQCADALALRRADTLGRGLSHEIPLRQESWERVPSFVLQALELDRV